MERCGGGRVKVVGLGGPQHIVQRSGVYTAHTVAQKSWKIKNYHKGQIRKCT